MCTDSRSASIQMSCSPLCSSVSSVVGSSVAALASLAAFASNSFTGKSARSNPLDEEDHADHQHHTSKRIERQMDLPLLLEKQGERDTRHGHPAEQHAEELGGITARAARVPA